MMGCVASFKPSSNHKKSETNHENEANQLRAPQNNSARSSLDPREDYKYGEGLCNPVSKNSPCPWTSNYRNSWLIISETKDIYIRSHVLHKAHSITIKTTCVKYPPKRV